MFCRFADTDVPEEAVAIYKKLKKQWQQIKTHSLEVGVVLSSIVTVYGYSPLESGEASCLD
jgi:hypothetical protein